MACLDENQVVALACGRLDPAQLEEVQLHLDSCRDCQDLVGFYQQSTLDSDLDNMGTMDDHLPPGEFAQTPRQPLLPPEQDPNFKTPKDPVLPPLTETEEINLINPPGSRIGRYEVVRSLGRGGMGVVYLARDPELGRRVALKLVKPTLQGDERADHFEKRLMREARAMARLTHPNVLTIYDVGIHQGQVFLASEWIDGGTMVEWLATGSHRLSVIVSHFREAAKGLVAAHAAGLVHRDFKPSNVMIGKDDRVLVFDFGLVKTNADTMGDITTQLSGKFVVGTPAYMSPEQMIGDPATEKSDQFSFCASLYEAISGKRPYTGRSLTELLSNIGKGQLEEPKGAPKWLWEMLQRGLRRKPSERYASMAEVHDILDRGLTARKRRSVVAALAIGAVGLAGAGGLGYWKGHSENTALCADARTVLGDAWSEDRRESVKLAILGSEADYAKDVWRNVSRLFDNYAREWQIQLRASCMETRVYKNQSEEIFRRRAACFSRLRAELDTVTTRLQEGDLDAVRGAVAMAQTLTTPGECGPQAVEADSSLPQSEGERGKLEALWPEFKTIETMIITGKLTEAIAKVEELLVRAEGHRPTEARLWAAQGEALGKLGRHAESTKALEMAFYAAVAGKYDSLAARVATDIFSVFALILEDDASATRWRHLAQSAVERSSSDLVRGRWLRIQGVYDLQVGELDSAESRLQSSLVVLEKEVGRFHGQVAATLAGLGNCYIAMRKAEKAEAMFRRALAIWVETNGPHHPETAIAQIHLATALIEQGKLEEARTITSGGVDILVANYGEEDSRVQSALLALARYAVSANDYDSADQSLLRALATERSKVASDTVQRVNILRELSRVSRLRARPEDALVYLGEAVELAQGLTPVPESMLMELRLQLGETFLSAGQHREALSTCLQVVDSIGTPSQDTRITHGRTASCLGRAYLREGKGKTARTWLRRAQEALEPTGDSPGLGLTLAAMAELGSGEEALRLAARAQQILQMAGPLWALERRQCEEHLDRLRQ